MLKNRKGFTLVELLAVVVLMGILMVLAIPAVSRQIDDSRGKAFYASVYNVVNDLRLSNIESANNNCIYNYTVSEGSDSNIGELNIWAHQDQGKTVYSVYAHRVGNEDGDADIDVYDFAQTDTNKDTWVKEGDESYSDRFTEFTFNILDLGNLSDSFLNTINVLGPCIEEE